MSKKFIFAFCLLIGLGTAHQAKAQKSIGNSNSSFSHSHNDQAPGTVPSHRTCGSALGYQNALDKNPALAEWVEADRKQYQDYLQDTDRFRTSGTVTIPVVFHVIYSVSQNLVSDSRLQSQITVLNDDYGRTNSDAGNTPAAFQGIAANSNIQFCLASEDPNGAPTTGINRIQSNLANTQYPSGEAGLKALIQWDHNKYLNVWVVENINSGQVLGYATFPSAAIFNPQLDGVVLSQQYTGVGSPGAPFNLGRTATHEVGHWLGLYHTFQGGCAGLSQGTCASQGDEVCDTPPTSGPNYNCPGTQNTCNETFPSNQNDMTMNYMDYVNDNCMNMFSTGQSDRMNYYLNTSRSNLITSTGCSNTGGPVTQCPGTDTVNFPVVGTLITYTSTAGGYISGHNSYGDAAKAEYYANTQGFSSVSGMRFLFGAATAASSNSTVTAKIWDDSNGAPGQVITSETININDIIAANGDVTVMFTNPVTVSGAFYVGVDIDYTTAGDTIALITNTQGDISTNTAWEQFSNGDWYPYDDASSWGVSLSNSAHPVIEGMEVSVSPANPNIPTGGSIQLITTSTVSNVTYTWSPATGLSCTTCANPVASPAASTTYTLTTTDVVANCTTLTSVMVSVGPVGIENDLFEEVVSAYPNPSNGNFMLEFTSTEINNLDIKVFNNLGQSVYNEKLDGFSGDYRKGIDLNLVPAGVYHLRITNGEKAYFEKLIFN